MASKFRGIRDGKLEPLCKTCDHAQYIQGESLVNVTLLCHKSDWVPREMEFEATTCSMYSDRRLPSQYEMEKIAWRINSDAKAGKIGFISPKEWKQMKGNEDD